MVQRVPAVEQLAGRQVCTPARPSRPARRCRRRRSFDRSIGMFLLAVTHAWSPSITISCRVGTQPPVALQRRDRLVVLVDDDVLAGHGLAGVGEVALPPRQHRLALVGLEAEVAGDDVLGHRLEPHGRQVVVVDQRSALADDRRLGQVVEVGDEDVALRQLVLVGHDVGASDRRMQARLRHEAVGVAAGRVLRRSGRRASRRTRSRRRRTLRSRPPRPRRVANAGASPAPVRPPAWERSRT